MCVVCRARHIRTDLKVESPYGSKQNEATSSSAKGLQEKRQVSFSADKLTYRLVRTCSSHASICDAAVLWAPAICRLESAGFIVFRLLPLAFCALTRWLICASPPFPDGTTCRCQQRSSARSWLRTWQSILRARSREYESVTG